MFSALFYNYIYIDFMYNLFFSLFSHQDLAIFRYSDHFFTQFS